MNRFNINMLLLLLGLLFPWAEIQAYPGDYTFGITPGSTSTNVAQYGGTFWLRHPSNFGWGVILEETKPDYEGNADEGETTTTRSGGLEGFYSLNGRWLALDLGVGAATDAKHGYGVKYQGDGYHTYRLLRLGVSLGRLGLHSTYQNYTTYGRLKQVDEPGIHQEDSQTVNSGRSILWGISWDF